MAAPIAVRRRFQKKLVDCENYESGGGNYDNTWADQQALIARVNTGAPLYLTPSPRRLLTRAIPAPS